jgi:serine/threonine protein kinase
VARGIKTAGIDTLVAAKRLKPNADAAMQREFAAEIQLMMRLRHPNIVNLLGTVTTGAESMALLEYLPGGSLDVWLQSPAAVNVTGQDRLYVLYQVAMGLRALHKLHIIHRDVAARNVLVGVHLTCKIADYGLSREVSDEREYYKYKNKRILPLRWTAPEVFRKLEWTYASDVFAVGVFAYEVR